MYILSQYYLSHHPVILGPESSGEHVNVVLKSQGCREYPYLGYLPKRQAFVLPDSRKVKISVLGFCQNKQGHGFEEISEGWFVLGQWIKTGVFIVVESGKPISFFAPQMSSVRVVPEQGGHK